METKLILKSWINMILKNLYITEEQFREYLFITTQEEATLLDEETEKIINKTLDELLFAIIYTKNNHTLFMIMTILEYTNIYYKKISLEENNSIKVNELLELKNLNDVLKQLQEDEHLAIKIFNDFISIIYDEDLYEEINNFISKRENTIFENSYYGLSHIINSYSTTFISIYEIADNTYTTIAKKLKSILIDKSPKEFIGTLEIKEYKDIIKISDIFILNILFKVYILLYVKDNSIGLLDKELDLLTKIIAIIIKKEKRITKLEDISTCMDEEMLLLLFEKYIEYILLEEDLIEKQEKQWEEANNKINNYLPLQLLLEL